MSVITNRTRIVVGLDLTEYSEIVLEHAMDLARRHVAPELHFLTVAEAPADDAEALKRALGTLIGQALEGLDRASWYVRLHVRSGEAPVEITDLAAEIRAHMIVIGRFGTHHEKKLGTTAVRVVELATTATLVVGLTDQSPDAVDQCPRCVAARAETDGRQWFCTDHVATRHHLSTMSVPPTWTGGTLMW